MKKAFQRAVALALVTAMFTCEASAAIKNVEVWGVKSVNDLGQSDKVITMEELQEDYKGYLQTDGMTEFFHKDQGAIPKKDMTEALAWLLDNNIISRDETIRISNTGYNKIPNVTITKSDINSKLYLPVHRSDALMYIYKAAFGELDGRGVGIEADSVRVDHGQPITLRDLLAKWKAADAAAIAAGREPEEKRYTPQAEEYTSMWGDTNVFISENHFNQEAIAGDGGDGINGGVGGAGGKAENTINYETDYKAIHLIPGCDFLVYKTSDVIEMYLQALLTKGLVEFDASLRSDKFNDTFNKLTVDNATKASWSGDVDPYIVNLSRGMHNRSEDVAYSKLAELLGVNYHLNYASNSLTISRNQLFESNTGYFTTENLTRMDIYRYIYSIISASEKKLSELEAEIVNFKYGMQYDGAIPEDDVEVIKYLVAKGILDYNGSSELSNLYGTVTWGDFIPVLYRVANKDARLDFSLVQLTDSEQAWKAKGFAPQTVNVVNTGSVGTVQIDYAEELTESFDAMDMSATPLDSRGITIEADAAGDTTTLIYQANAGTLSLYDFYFDAWGLNRSSSDVLNYFENQLTLLDSTPISKVEKKIADGYDVTNPRHNITVRLLKNVFFINMVQGQGKSGVYARGLKNALDDWNESTVKSTLDKATRTQIYNEFTGYLDAILAKSNEQTPIITRAYVGSGSQFNVSETSVRNLTVGNNSAGNSYISTLQRIEFEYKGTSDGVPNKYELLCHSKDIDAFVWSVTGNFDEDAKAMNERLCTVQEHVSLDQMKKDEEREIMEFSGSIGSLSLSFSETSVSSDTTAEWVRGMFDNAKLETYVDPQGESAFVSWKSLQEQGANIERISDTVLKNTVTGTLAYFSTETDAANAVALVGTSVVKGDPNLGVAYKTSDVDSGQMFYYWPAIRQLLCLTENESKISGCTSYAMSSEALMESAEDVEVISESGVKSTAVQGIRALMTYHDTLDRTAFNDRGSPTDCAYYAGVKGGADTRWGDFIELSSTGRVGNHIWRKLTYKVSNATGNGERTAVAYVVIRFVGTDLAERSTTTAAGNVMSNSSIMTSNSSLQDLLDAPGAQLTNSAEWSQNKSICNAFANWAYGTSGKEYINTGYLEPEVTVYHLGDAGSQPIPTSLWGSITSEQRRERVVHLSMGAINGKIIKLTDSPPQTADALHKLKDVAYYVSSDYAAMVEGDRLFLNRWVFDNLDFAEAADGTKKFYATNGATRGVSFTVGSTFNLFPQSTIKIADVNYPAPTAKVIKTEGDMVTCQVGPIYGAPLRWGETATQVIDSAVNDTVGAIGSYTFGGDPKSLSVWERTWSLFQSSRGLYNVKRTSTRPYSKPSIDSTTSDGVRFVFDGTNITAYSGTSKGKSVAVPSVDSPSNTLNSYFSNMASKTVSGLKAGFSSADSNSKVTVEDLKATEAYYLVEFSLLKHSIREGMLVETSNAAATSFLSPLLFTSLNTVIVDGIIDEASGAIPLNEVPQGYLVKIGSGYYQALGEDSKSKQFVGYSFLDTDANAASVQTAGMSFASHFVLAGNQYVNICHFFDVFKVLGDSDTKANGVQTGALNVIASATLGNETAKWSLDGSGKKTQIVPGSLAGGKTYAPVSIEFIDGLLAHQVADVGGITTYEIVNHTETSVSGAFDTVPFLANDVLGEGLRDITTTTVSSAYQPSPNDKALLQAFNLEMQKAFGGDLVTLARMILLLVIMWLMLASWCCYFLRLGNLMPILESIRYPSGDHGRKGIDLMKIFSLGTISLDTEFGLGKFIQYNAILCCLLLVVRITGNITV